MKYTLIYSQNEPVNELGGQYFIYFQNLLLKNIK